MKSPAALWRLRAALCVLALAAYANSLGLGFALDGRRMALEDVRVQAATAQNLELILGKQYWWPSMSGGLYRPLATASYLFNYAILGNGQNGTGYHVFNFLLHALNVLLVFELARAVLKAAWPALFAAALWAVHPVGTEAVANVAGRADLLSAAGVLGALLLYLRVAEGARPAVLYALGIFAAASIGLFSKESGAVLIGLMLLWDVAFGFGGREGFRRRLPAYGAAAAATLWMYLARRSVMAAGAWTEHPFADNPLVAADFLSARLTALKVIGKYLAVLVWPANLSFDYSYNQIPIAGLADPGVWIALAVIAAILAVVILRHRKDRVAFWAAGFFGIALLPTANLVVLIGSIMALRFLYLPSVGFAIIVAALAFRLRNEKAARAVMAAAILLCFVWTVMRNPAWANDGTLAAADVTASPRSYRTHRLLAAYTYNQSPQNNLDRAISEMEIAWDILKDLPPDKGDPQVATDLGTWYRLKGDRAGEAGRGWHDRAVTVLSRARAMTETQAAAVAAAQVAHGRPLPARTGSEALYRQLAKAQAALGRVPEAVQVLRDGRDINPLDRAFYDEIATFYANAGRLDAAAIIMLEKVQVFGLSPATATSLRNLYSRIPEGACAVEGEGGATNLNLGCAPVREHMCIGWADLARTYDRARFADRAQKARNDAGQMGCQADLFRAGAALPML